MDDPLAERLEQFGGGHLEFIARGGHEAIGDRVRVGLHADKYRRHRDRGARPDSGPARIAELGAQHLFYRLIEETVYPEDIGHRRRAE